MVVVVDIHVACATVHRRAFSSNPPKSSKRSFAASALSTHSLKPIGSASIACNETSIVLAVNAGDHCAECSSPSPISPCDETLGWKMGVVRVRRGG
jgi:hypothetical protein